MAAVVQVGRRGRPDGKGVEKRRTVVDERRGWTEKEEKRGREALLGTEERMNSGGRGLK